MLEMHSAEQSNIINAQQAKSVSNYKNTKLKLLETNAANWFNKLINQTYTD
jgi:hypothetical protein